VRREMDFLVTIMIGLSSLIAAGPHPRRLCLRGYTPLGFGWITYLLSGRNWPPTGCVFSAMRGAALVGLSIGFVLRI